MPAQILFIPYTTKHLIFITELYNHYVLHSTATYHIQPLLCVQVNECFQLANPETCAYVMEIERQEAGFCLLKPYSAREGYRFTREVSIYLKPEYWRKGIGQRALHYLETKARENSVHVLVAGICAENESSIGLFEKCGYQRCGYFREMGYKFARRLDNVYYQKILTDPG